MGDSILGEGSSRLRTAGRIRTGIKRLTKAAAENEAAVKAYSEGVRDGLSFDAIDSRIQAILDTKKSCLTPQNTPFFIARPGDFASPAIAQALLDQHGVDQDGRRRLYSFPIVLPFDDWLLNMPHQLVEHGKQGRKHWSEYHGGQRMCMTHGNINVDKNRRVTRWFGGRPTVPSTHMPGGKCEPNSCPIYGEGKCALGGRLIFWVPDVGAGAPFDLLSSSYYSMEQWRDTMHLVQSVRGRISGFHRGEPFLRLIKVEDEVSRVDPSSGAALKTTQYLVHMEVTVDLTELASERGPMLSAEQAATMLTGPGGDFDTDTGELAPYSQEKLGDEEGF